MAASVIGMRLTVYIRFSGLSRAAFAILVHFQHALETAVVVGAVLLLDAGEDELVIGELDAIAGLHPQVLLDAVVLGAGDADDADCEPTCPRIMAQWLLPLAHAGGKTVFVGGPTPRTPARW